MNAIKQMNFLCFTFFALSISFKKKTGYYLVLACMRSSIITTSIKILMRFLRWCDVTKRAKDNNVEKK